MVLGNRKIGLGIMGFADALLQLGIPYNSFQAVDLAKELMEFIQRTSRKHRGSWPEERGCLPHYKRQSS